VPYFIRRKIMWQWIGNIAALATLAGLSLAQFLTDSVKAWLALVAWLLLLVYIGFLVARTISTRWALKFPKGYSPISTVGRLITTDGKHLVYETTRHIQIKTAVMRHFEHRFFWTGSKDPVITSTLQEPSKIDPIPGEKTKCVRLKFKQTRVFDEVEVIHIRMDLDDSDQTSKPYLSHRVETPITLISWRIELLHAANTYHGSHAVITRTALSNQGNPVEEHLEKVPFDAITKSFLYSIIHPEPGYQYCMTWPKP
jgi:hypothetical protein